MEKMRGNPTNQSSVSICMELSYRKCIVEEAFVEDNQATANLILDADVVLLDPDICVSAGGYFSKCIKHGTAIEGQIHSKSRKSWKSDKN